MHTDQNQIATELIAALGVLAQTQELRADDDKLSGLAARVRNAESEFRVLFVQRAVA